MPFLLLSLLVPIGIAVAVWALALRSNAQFGTGKVLVVGLAIAVGVAVTSAIATAGAVVEVIDTMGETPAQRSIDVDVTWYDTVAVVDLVVERADQRVTVPKAERVPDTFADRAHATRATGDARIPDPSGDQLRMWATTRIGWPLLWTVVGTLAAFVLLEAVRARPFGRRTGSLVAIGGYVLLVVVPLLAGVDSLLSDRVAAASLEWIGSRPSSTSTNLLLPFLPGLGTLALAAIFRRGVELAEQEAMTV